MIGIIGAMEIEVNALKAMLEEAVIKKISGIEFVSGRIYGKDVVVAACGVGKVFAAIAAEAMILVYKPELIINSGVAGALSPKLSVADIAIASEVVQHDMDTTPLGEPPGFLSGINKVKLSAAKRAAEVLAASVEALGIQYLMGTIASGDVFVDTAERKIEIAERFGAIACEMEGASIGHVCYVNDVDFAVIRAISDSLTDHSGMEFSEFVGIAAKNSIQVMDLFLKNY